MEIKYHYSKKLNHIYRISLSYIILKDQAILGRFNYQLKLGLNPFKDAGEKPAMHKIGDAWE